MKSLIHRVALIAKFNPTPGKKYLRKFSWPAYALLSKLPSIGFDLCYFGEFHGYIATAAPASLLIKQIVVFVHCFTL